MRLPSLAIPEPLQKKPGAGWVRDSHGHMQVPGRIRGYFTQEIALDESIKALQYIWLNMILKSANSLKACYFSPGLIHAAQYFLIVSACYS
ncbi:MAG: hypothetical protein DSZ28_02685 [Thiothrix sp.]|nr:MAG: hypothetical protein DSZ28_02685 [Thiothrix sp.]